MTTSASSIESPVQSSLPVDAWYTRCPGASPFSIAIQLGWLGDEFGAEPETKFRALQTSKDPKIHQSHYSHTQKNSFRHGGVYPGIWAQSAGSNTRLIGLSWTHGSGLILARPGSGLKTPADLKGKRLHLLRRPKEEDIDFIAAGALRTYETALASAGLTLSDVHIVEHVVDRLLVSDRVQYGNVNYVSFSKNRKVGRGVENVWGLLNGEADAIVGTEKLVEELGLDIVYDGAQSLDPSVGSPRTFAVSAELIEERPEFVARVYARTLQAVEWSRNNRSEAVRIVAREQGRTEQQVEDAYGERFFDALEIGLQPEHIEGLRRVKDFALRHGFLKSDFDVDAWIDPRPLEAARALLEERRASAQYRAEIAPRPPLIRGDRLSA